MVINFYGVNINLMDYPKLNAEIQKIIVYPFKDNGNTPCFAVVADISTYTETTYKDVYDQKTKKWYKLNNLNQYEEYGVYESTDDLSTITTYVGKLAIYNGHEYKWNGTEWVDLGEIIDNKKYYLSQYQTVNGFEYILPYYWGEGYKMVVYCYFTGGYSGDIGLISNYWSDNICHSPIEFTSYQNGYYFDSHDPISTTSNECNTGDYSNRLYHTGLSFPKDGTKLRFEITYQKALIYNDETDTLLDTYGSARTGYTWYDGLYIGNFGTRADSSNAKAFTNKVIVYDADGNIVNNCEFKYDATATDAKKLYLYDSVLNARYENNYTGTTALQYAEEEGEPSYPVEYDTKVAPADNVEYDTLEELELMECPWVGMHAIIGGNKYYVYTENLKWEELQSYINFDMNDQWVESTKNIDGYYVYMSNSNYHVGSAYASMKVTFFGYSNFKLYINSYGERSNDYTIAWTLDQDAPTSNPSYTSSGVVAHTRRNQKDPSGGLTNFTEVSYPNDGGKHFVWITYRKDSSVDSDDDRGYLAVQMVMIAYKYEIATDEYIKGDDGKYYQKLYKYGTPDNINWYNTGEYKAGDELTTTDVTASTEYLKVDSLYYAKVYKYVTLPNGSSVNTGDYIQGEQLETTNIDDGDTTCVDGYLYHYLHVYVIINGNNIATTDYVLGDVIGEATFSIEGTTNATSNFSVTINNESKTAYIIS